MFSNPRPSFPRPIREHNALICYGEGQRYSNQLRSGYEWDADRRRHVPRSGVELQRQDYDTSVTVEIDGGRGRIRPAKSMAPPIHGDNDAGWYEISDLSIGRDMIRGQFRLNGANRPRITIDRRAGRIMLDGLTKFSGTCDPQDGDPRHKTLAGVACRGAVTVMLKRKGEQGGTLDPLLLDFRNRELAARIVAAPQTHIYVNYGAEHLKGLLADLRKTDPNWKVESVKWMRAMQAPEDLRGETID